MGAWNAIRERFAAEPEARERGYKAGTFSFNSGTGRCPACGGTGYHGRTSILETLVVNDTIRRLILDRADAAALQQAGVENGMRVLFDNGMEKAVAGVTSIEEVMQATRDR